jgi:hypothetical protein
MKTDDKIKKEKMGKAGYVKSCICIELGLLLMYKSLRSKAPM